METVTGKIISINISEKKRTVKKPVSVATVIRNFGVVGDAHSGSSRQVSFLGWEAVEKFRIKNSRLTGLGGQAEIRIKIEPGDFAENITTDGIDWDKAKVGDNIIVGETVKLKITQIGKECNVGCAIRKAVGDCIMPKQGIFAKVLVGGDIKIGDSVVIARKSRCGGTTKQS
ncbi:MAG: MOSC domain-containing protein [Elusimicrobiota bacterium]